MLRCSPLFAFQEHIIAVKEFKMLKLETLLMLMNSVSYEYRPRCLKSWQRPI